MPDNITREEWSEELAEQALMDFQDMQDNILLILAARLEQIRKLTPEEAKSMAKSAALAKWLNHDISLVKRAIKQQDRKYSPIIVDIIEQIEEENYKYAQRYLEYRKKQITREQFRSGMDKRIKAIQKEVLHNVLNLSHTYCYVYNGKVAPVGQVYRKIVNKGVLSASIGVDSFDQTMRKAIDELAKSGLKTVGTSRVLSWDKGKGEKPVIRSADAHIRMNLMEGINRINAEMQKEAGKVFGADGVELSLHSLCAPDHQHIQGKQFTKEEYDSLNAGLKRPIGTLNCRHIAMPIIYGVTPPVHTEEERLQVIQRSNRKVNYNGREMTRYEASQRMRGYERDIRILRSKLKAYEKAGALKDAKETRSEIKKGLAKYRDFCKQTGLTERLDRTRYYI